jgi:osmotically-inducible protein OsmY
MKTDSQLLQDVYEELKWTPDVTAADIGVTVKDGVVTLTGSVPSYAEKYAAEAAVRRVSGVTAVAEELQVRLPQPHNDQEIAQAAINALHWHVWIPKDIQVTVENGCVKLTGQVKWGFQRQAAETAVRFLKGVVLVDNLITLKPSVANNTVVKQKIKLALQRNAQIDAHSILVQTSRGKVTLSGCVRSWIERQEAENAAWAAPGVQSVDNEIVVAA